MPFTRISARAARLSALLLVLATTLVVGQGSALAAGHISKTRTVTTTLPPEGMFDSCSLATNLSTCEQDLQVMSQAGLKVVVNSISGVSEQNLQSYAAYAQSVGMSVMWELNDPGFWGGAWIGSSAANDYPEFAADCGCTGTAAVLSSTISFLSSLPGTYGYYAADDESIARGATAGLTTYVNEIKSDDPNHMVMIGSSASQGQTNASAGAVLGNEIYPETTSNIANEGNNLAAWAGVQQQVTQAQTASTKNHEASAFILQAFTFGDNLSDGEAVGVCTPNMSQSHCAGLLLYPSELVEQELRNQVLEHSHASLILWFNFDETFDGSGHGTAFTQAIQAPAPTIQATAASAKSKRTRGDNKRSGKRKTSGRTKATAQHKRSPKRGGKHLKRTRKRHTNHKRTTGHKHTTPRWYRATN